MQVLFSGCGLHKRGSIGYLPSSLPIPLIPAIYSSRSRPHEQSAFAWPSKEVFETPDLPSGAALFIDVIVVKGYWG